LKAVLDAARELSAPDEASEPGRRLGDFQLIRHLGRGGMGTVWEAEQISLGRRVALKILARHLSLSDDTVDRFRREASAGGRLRHPSIVAVYEIGEIDGDHYIAQELVPGGFSMADFLKQLHEQPELPDDYYPAVAALFAKVADALEVAHEAGIVHRDIKPGNILIDENDQPKVADFGLAKVNDDLVLSRTGELAGTPYYMSPEQATSRNDEIDGRSDVFSLGATLFEALTLVRPFEGDTSQQVLEKIVMEDPPDPRKLRSKVPWDLSVICLKALEKKPDQRYASMSEFAADLRRFLADEPIVAHPPGAATRMFKWTRRHPVLSVSSSVAGVAFVAVMSLFIQLQDQNLELQRTRDELAATQQEKDELLKETVANEREKWSHLVAGALSGRKQHIPAMIARMGADSGLDEDSRRELARALRDVQTVEVIAGPVTRGRMHVAESVEGEVLGLEDLVLFEGGELPARALPPTVFVRVIEREVTGPLDELLGKGDVDVGTLLSEADTLFSAGKRREALRIYYELRRDYPFTVVYQLNKERITDRIDITKPAPPRSPPPPVAPHDG
jgi:serine/threonine protein kinase